jgi:transposase
MFLAPGSFKIYLCSRDTDMRKGFSGLSADVRVFMQNNPLNGSLFVFRNKRGDRIKILVFDRDGFVLWYKQLQKGTFRFPACAGNSIEIDYSTLMMILDGIDLKSVRRQKRFALPSTKLLPDVHPP